MRKDLPSFTRPPYSQSTEHPPTIQLNHGSGGQLTHRLLTQVFFKHFDNEILNRYDDSARLNVNTTKLCFTTDSYVVDPIFFPGGCIGDLAVNGTLNDLSVCGSRPLYISAAFILEEGLPLASLERIVIAMKEAADRAGVLIVTGDTKVVNRGSCDKIFITTSGIGACENKHPLGPDQLQPGDRIIVSGAVANHGMAILSKREGLAFESPIQSDTAAIHPLVEVLLARCGDSLRAMRDPTRGGVAAVLNEFAESSGVGIELEEASIPVDPPVAGACEILGIDPLYVANEGKLIAVVAPDRAETALAALREHPLARQAAIVGTVTGAHAGGLVSLRTRLGGHRLVDMPLGEQLPRIC